MRRVAALLVAVVCMGCDDRPPSDQAGSPSEGYSHAAPEPWNGEDVVTNLLRDQRRRCEVICGAAGARSFGIPNYPRTPSTHGAGGGFSCECNSAVCQ